jgi:hypothetical protein
VKFFTRYQPSGINENEMKKLVIRTPGLLAGYRLLKPEQILLIKWLLPKEVNWEY